MPKINCPTCHKKIRPPDHLAGRRVVCPRCEAVLTVPENLAQAIEEAANVESTSPVEDPPFPPAARLGMISIGLGLCAILIICLPVIGYLSAGLSGIGLLLGLAGLYRSWTDSDPLPPQVAAGGVGIWSGFGTRTRDYPLAGIAACFLALALALVPTLVKHWSTFFE